MTSTTRSQPEKSPRVNNEMHVGAREMRFDGANANAMRVGRSASKAMRDAAAKRTQRDVIAGALPSHAPRAPSTTTRTSEKCAAPSSALTNVDGLRERKPSQLTSRSRRL